MPFFNWKESYSVGINEFDQHHQQLFVLINQLYDAMHDGKGTQELQPVLDNLIQYTAFHFSSEEKQMAKFGYPEYAKHCALHTSLTDQVIEFQEKSKKNQIGMSIQVANFLKDWLTNHILIEDKKYQSFFQTKGINSLPFS